MSYFPVVSVCKYKCSFHDQEHLSKNNKFLLWQGNPYLNWHANRRVCELYEKSEPIAGKWGSNSILCKPGSMSRMSFAKTRSTNGNARRIRRPLEKLDFRFFSVEHPQQKCFFFVEVFSSAKPFCPTNAVQPMFSFHVSDTEARNLLVAAAAPGSMSRIMHFYCFTNT